MPIFHLAEALYTKNKFNSLDYFRSIGKQFR